MPLSLEERLLLRTLGTFSTLMSRCFISTRLDTASPRYESELRSSRSITSSIYLGLFRSGSNTLFFFLTFADLTSPKKGWLMLDLWPIAPSSAPYPKGVPASCTAFPRAARGFVDAVALASVVPVCWPGGKGVL